MQRVLITRPEPGASETAVRLAALGFYPTIAPILSIIHRQVGASRHLAAIVLTSRNAVEACPQSLHGHRVFTVGNATAMEATKAGFGHVSSADGNAAALANLIAATLSPRDGVLLLPAAQGQGRELATSLRDRGFRVLRRVAYQAALVDTLPQTAASWLATRQEGAAMFFSGETSRHFVRLLRSAKMVDAVRDVEAVSISDRAAVPLKALPWRRIHVAIKPNQDAMLSLLR